MQALSSILGLMLDLSRRLPSYRVYARTLIADELENTVVSTVDSCQKFVKKYIEKSGMNPNEQVTVLPREVERYFRAALKRNLGRTWNKSKRYSDLRLGDTYTVDAVLPEPEVQPATFWNRMEADNHELYTQLEFEMAFYLYVINNYLPRAQREIVDAFVSNDKELQTHVREKHGTSTYYVVVHRLFKEGRFHRLAIRAAQKLLENQEFRHFPQGTRGKVLRMIEKLEEQIPAGEKP